MMRLSEIAQAVHGELIGRDARIQGVSTDTRTLNDGELFVALKGPKFDGHAFIEAARRAGAAGALVQSEQDSPLPVVKVADSLKALGELAAAWRARFSIPLVAVTGSNGKTTVKEMIGSILTLRAPALISTGNLNNDIGVPLVLCGLRPEHRYAVIEMGMNHPGEIDYLSRLARPTVALINNAAPAHLEGLGSVEAVADAKGEIINGLDDGGVVVLNRDDPFFDHWQSMAGSRAVLSFGFDPRAEVRAADGALAEGRFLLQLRDRTVEVELPLAGRHNIANALAAAAAASAVGIDAEQIKAGLERVRPVPGRLCVRGGAGGARLLDDSYNANPASVAAGIEVLAAYPGRRVLVLGDMAELGAEARALHQRAGEQARERGIDALYGLGDMSGAAVEAFGAGGAHYHDREALIEALRDEAGPGTTFLIKGSRSMRMDEIVAALAENNRAREGVR
ncbi:MAG TPA: UDP-N-acetylmuramoyl-tripeptide--D-alanyl-D-alanine ligase [Arenicellales bacterium]|nr:UDP-N-acetylmuramoyl-tripeptide--D-alanyl-D-alanine ligase [Arenicellales bacterium]